MTSKVEFYTFLAYQNETARDVCFTPSMPALRKPRLIEMFVWSYDIRVNSKIKSHKFTKHLIKSYGLDSETGLDSGLERIFKDCSEHKDIKMVRENVLGELHAWMD